MFPTRINSSPPPPSTTGTENVAPSNSGPSQSTISRQKPWTLGDLPRNRAKLLESKNPAAKIIGKGLEDLLDEAVAGTITSSQHSKRCYEMLEAVEMLKEGVDVDEKLLSRNNLDGILKLPQKRPLNDHEFLAVNDELAVHLDSERGVEAVHRRTADTASQANRQRGRFEAQLESPGRAFARSLVE